MHKKIALVSLALIMVFALVSTAAAAPKAMANTTQKGSLLVFPKIIIQDRSEETGGWKDTIIFLSNDQAAQVWVQCYWMDENQTVEDFNFKLTPNQPIFFSAMYGQNLPLYPIIMDPPVTVPPFNPVFFGNHGVGAGALYCWAVNEADSTAINFNHLYGNALIVSGHNVEDTIYIDGSVLYNAYSFVVHSAIPAAAADGTQTLPLDGVVFDACPSYLLANFTPGGEFISPDQESALTLVPCKQDLTQDRTPTYTKAKFDIWNANETKYTGAYQCLKCFAEFQLDDIGTDAGKTFGSDGKYIGIGFGGDKFTPFSLKTLADRFRVYGVASTVCKTATTPTGLLGLLLYEERNNGPINAGTTLHGAGLATGTSAGFVKWDIGSASQEAPGK